MTSFQILKYEKHRIKKIMPFKDTVKQKEYDKKYYLKNKEKINNFYKKYYLENTKKMKNNQKNYYYNNFEKVKNNSLIKKYNLTLKEYNERLKNQGDNCPICNKSMKKSYKGPCLDHDHENNKIREFLCIKCNTTLGLLKENPIIIKKMYNYLMKHKTDEQIERMGIKGKARQTEEHNRLSESVQKEIERVNIEVKKSENSLYKWMKVLKEKARRYDLMRFALRKTGTKV